MRLSHYETESELGRGGMGVVYRATDTRLGRPVALKTLLPETVADPDRRRRFVQEARSASALNHPHIVTIYDVGEQDGTTFIAMELVEGTPLDRILAAGPLPVQVALDYATQIASGLQAAHERGIIHRDIKPANVMISRDGRVKVLDFGLAKLVEDAPTDATRTAVTRAGVIVGTAAYMSPEQAQGRPVDARSDIFSFGAVLYEMLTGRRAFVADSDIGLITAILRDQPAPLRSVRADVPAGVQSVMDRCLAKDPAERYQSAVELQAALAEIQRSLSARSGSPRRRRIVLASAAALLLLLAAIAVWQTLQLRRVRWAREQLPEIERLQATDRSVAAVRLAREVERYLPEEVARIRHGWYRFDVITEPEGASIEVRNYVDVDGEWESLGQTPLPHTALPVGMYRVRITKPGYEPVEISASAAGRRMVKLATAGSPPDGMVLVAGGSYTVGVAERVVLPDFWIDRQEVTNRQFKQFVDAGGYRDPRYWKRPFETAGGVLSFEQAMARFRDATGRNAPAGWELASYPEGHGDYPVGGISWFEAAAYAEFAGKSLPSIYHWYRAAGADDLFSDVLRLSNFDGKGPVRVGERGGLGPWGTVDMGGNVKEWCVNGSSDSRRYILGGGWNEPSYRFREVDARDPWERDPTFGVRLIRSLGPADHASVPVPKVYGDPASLVPVDDKEFELMRRFYAYDRTPVNARVEGVDDSSPHYRKETVSFDAAYGRERIPAYVFLPKNARPPYQTVVLFPNAYALFSPSSEHLDLATFTFIIRSGRALIYPVYKGTFERGGGRPTGVGPAAVRDVIVQMAKDVFRTIDYLEERPDVDKERLAYFSISMGAFFGPIPVALDPRLKVAVFAAGGLRFNRAPEVQAVNFMPRVKVPVLLVNGRDDFEVPVAAQQRFIELIGTPAEHKRHVMLEGGHVPNDIREMFRETLDWFDKYLGPVQ